MSTDIAIRESAVPALVEEPAVLASRAPDPQAAIAFASECATILRDVLVRQRLITRISGNDHVQAEGWTLLAAMTGYSPRVAWSRKVDAAIGDGWEACVELVDVSGRVVSAAEAMALRDENAKWSRQEYSVRSMAQTRATSRAIRLKLGYIVTMAGYSATAAEEMPTESAPSAPRGAVAAPPARGLHPGGDAPATGTQRSPSATPGASAGAGNQGPAGNTRSPAGPSLSPGKQTFVSIMERLGIRNTHANRSLAIERLTKCGITSDDLTDEAKAKDAVEVLRAAFGLKRKASVVVPIPSEDPKKKGASYDVTLSRVDDDTAAECTCDWFKLGGAGICKHVAPAWRNLFLSWLSPEPISPEEAWTGLDLSALADAADRAYAESAPAAAKRREPAPEPQAAA